MPRIYLCFLWHMHQPFYKDLLSGEYKLPWTRLHALKDYYGMVRLLEQFPTVRQTFNLVPSMMVQVEEYASGAAMDPLLHVALKPAEGLEAHQREFLLRQSFHGYPPRMIYRYPRYGELYDAHRAGREFTPRDLRDLQVWSQLAWFDEEFQEHDTQTRALIDKGRDYTLEDQRQVGEKQREIIAGVLPAYDRLAASGQIEISTTPYYHPILPLVCDSSIAAVSHPGVALPPRFRFPGDARRQLEMAREYVQARFGRAVAGLWPSEGSVSDEAFTIAAELGFEWAASDSGVLSKTLGHAASVEDIYRPYVWRQGGRELKVLFRDHFLSDLIGFVYSRLEAREAAADFLRRIHDNCRPILAGGRDALVPIILDGENAWEYYPHSGRPFLRELYGRIAADRSLEAVTISDALSRVPAREIHGIFPGSWIHANFDVWIGAEEDNHAWAQLLRAREVYDATPAAEAEGRRLALEELLIAEGSDWCWWYGPEHESPQRPEFDHLYRSHLANVYRALGLAAPDELSRPILRLTVTEAHQPPTDAVRPTIDGEVSSYFEWMGSGNYRVDERTGSMHGKKFPVRQLHYGSDGQNLFVRVDFHSAARAELAGMEVRLLVQAGEPARASSLTVVLQEGQARLGKVKLAAAGGPVDCAFREVLEVGVPLAALGAAHPAALRFQVAIWQEGLPVEAIPQQGWLELPATEPDWRQ